MALHNYMISRPSALQTSLRRVIRQCGFVSAEPQLAIAAPPEHQRLLDHNLLALTVSQIEVAHRDGDVAVDLDAVLRRVVVVAHLHPALQREALSSPTWMSCPDRSYANV
jgi:hypothetical protein